MKQIGKIAFALAATVIASTTWAKTYTLTVKSTDTSRGTVSGGGKYKTGTKLTVSAKAKSGYVFGGWFADKACTQESPNVIYKGNYIDTKVKVLVDRNAKMYAKFISKAADKKALKLSGLKKYASTAYEATIGNGFVTLPIGASYLSRSTLTFKNLPKGLEALGNGAIEGSPTVPGKYTVTATLTSAGGYKVTQKFKINIKAPAWARGNFYGAADIGGVMYDARASYYVNAYGNIEGKFMYKGKEYPFYTAYTSCTGEKAKFKVETKVGSKTFKSGTMTVLPYEEFNITTADGKFFWAQNSPKLLKSGNPLADLNYKSLTFTRDTPNSGLVKADDELTVYFMYADDDFVQVTGTVNGKKLEISRLIPLSFRYKSYYGEYLFAVYIIDDASRYSKILSIWVKGDSVEAEFIPDDAE